MSSRFFTFAGGLTGAWRIAESHVIRGRPLAPATHVDVVNGLSEFPADRAWSLRGVTSNERYVTRPEKSELLARQPALGRPQATCAALIVLRKSPAWWSLTQDERRVIFEDRSRHIRIGFDALPAVARRLHHCRDLGDSEPFDFLTWFEFAPADAPIFDALVAGLRATDEWSFIDREIEFRLRRV